MGWTRRAVLGGAAAVLASPPLRAAGAGDVAVLRRAYGLLHPGLLRYATAAEVDRRFDRLARDFDAAPDLAGRYIVLSRFLATIRCGHSYANFYNQKRVVQQALFDRADRLPIRFRWLGDRMIVVEDAWQVGLPPGTEVLAIDGRPAAAILAGLMTVARADGGNDGKRRTLMSVLGQDGYESFDVFYPLLFGGRDRYRLDVRRPDGRRDAATLAAIDLAARRAKLPPKVDDSGDTPRWRFERRGRTAILTMPGWGLYNSKWDWRGWLGGRFEDMARTGDTGLIIDIRGNEGGLSCGNAVLAHLVAEPLPGLPYRRLVRYRQVPDDLVPYLDTWDDGFRALGREARPYDARFLELPNAGDGSDDHDRVEPAGPRFAGRVALLIDGQNSSATFAFAQRVQAAGLATLVGEETGGNLHGINGGAFFFIRLPESGLEADLPLIGTFPPGPMPDRGIRPDRPVPLTAADIAAGNDRAIATALAAVV